MSRRSRAESPAILGRHALGGAEFKAHEALLRALEYNPREVILPQLDPHELEDQAAELASSFRKFIPKAWPIVEPSSFVPNWHIDAIAEHLEAVTHGDIQDILITMPPRHSKSLSIVVLWPTWEWIDLPFYRWVFASYAFSLSVRDSIKRRKVIRSAWYQERWADRFTLIEEQNTKIRYENDRNGYMLASSVGGSNTGEGGERIIADDPHNVKEGESEKVRKETVDWWNIVMSTRRNDASQSARVVVQQRVHEADVAGDIIDKGGYVHLNLPTEFGFGGGQRCKTGWTRKSDGRAHSWEDPRQEDGELLNPARFNHEANEKAKIDLGDYQYAAQHGQNPTPPKGQIIQATWLKYYGGPTGIPVPDWTRCTNPFMPMLSLDSSFKELRDTDFVAGLGWGQFGADIYLMPICIHKRMNFPDTINAIAEFVGGENLDGEKYPGIYPFIKMKLVETKANGDAIIDTLKHKVPGMIPFDPGNASKESRLQAGSWRFRSGNIFLPHESIAPWIKEYVYELCAFPKAKKDDYVDATSQMLLFIGGDLQVNGKPLMTVQTSQWMGRNEVTADGSESMISGSVWGAPEGGVGGSRSRSIWRK
jgi:predicted phage terminase large subunit-like protein